MSLWSTKLEAGQDETGFGHLKMHRAPVVNQPDQEMGAGGSSKLRLQMPIAAHKQDVKVPTIFLRWTNSSLLLSASKNHIQRSHQLI